MELESKISNLLVLAGHHKDRLHALQATEWNVYYAVWVVLLASFYFILSSSHVYLIDMADGISNVFSFNLPVDGWKIRGCRFVICTLFSILFYYSIWYFYFSLFYTKNYRSIIESRSVFYYYSNRAAALMEEVYFTEDCCPILTKDDLRCKIERLARNYKSSEIRKARIFVARSAIFLAVLLIGFTSALAPLKKPTDDLSIKSDVTVK